MASAVAVQLTGHEEGVRALHQLRDACGRFSGPLFAVGSPLPYAYGIETGRQRGGALARRAGPAHYLRGGLERSASRIQQLIARSLREGPEAAERAILASEQTLVSEAQALTPVRSGRLQGSLIAIRRGF